MSQMSFVDTEYADKRKRTARNAPLIQIDVMHPKADDVRPPYALKTDGAYPADAAREHCLGAGAVCALSNLWIARQWFAWAGELRL